MSRDYILQIEDILSSIEKIKEYTKHMDFDDFQADIKTQDAVIRNLEIIGEAARSIPEKIRSQSTNLDWKKIIGLRNVLIHEYFGVSIPIIWDVIQNKLDDLKNECLLIQNNY